MDTNTAIVTRTKDRPLLLQRAMNSVLAQTQTCWTHVIVNDGGDPAPVEDLARRYASKYGERLKVIHNGRSCGMEAASNIGIAQCTSDYILIHDDDDSLDARFLEKTMNYLDEPPYPTIQGVSTLVMKIREEIKGGQVTRVGEELFRSLNGCLSVAQIIDSNPVPPISFLFRRSAYSAIGPFDESLPVLGDWEFLIRFISKFDIGVVSEVLANYHIRKNSSSTMTNSIVDNPNRFMFYDTMIRNRILRNTTNPALAMLIQQNSRNRRLRRLYEHRFIGGFIRFWSKFVNSDIPPTP